MWVIFYGKRGHQFESGRGPQGLCSSVMEERVTIPRAIFVRRLLDARETEVVVLPVAVSQVS